MDPNAITYFGETDARNKKTKFGIKAKDRLKHVYVIGKTGMGKSTLLENMAIQDIQNGNGMAFIDPHGGTAEKLLDYVPEHRVKDVLYFAPFDMEYPVAFNIMEDIGIDKRHLVVNGLMSTFEKIWVDAWSARMAYILNNCLLALLEYPGSTLLGVNRMLADKEFRKKIVDNVKDPSVRAFWIEEFGKYTERFAAEATPAIQNKVGQFTANPLVRNLIGQSVSSFDIRKFMDEKKILIINLSKGKVGEGNANLIGSMLITKIYLAAMSRADATEQELAKLPNFYLYVDEFQSFANKYFADILSEARKYKLNLTIAHQYIEQMEEEVRDAVFGNVGTMIAFRVGAFDSEVLEKEFGPTFMATDLVSLGIYQMYLKLMIDGVTSQPFSAKGMAPISRPEISFKDAVIASSREQFAKPRLDVEKTIVDWHDAGTAREVGRENREGRPQAPAQSQNNNQNYSNTRSGERYPDRSTERQPERPREEYRPASPDLGRRQSNIQGEATTDENKQAFLRAKAMLEQSQNVQKAPSNPAPQQTVSLAQLRPEDNKKTPTKENMSNLKQALHAIINKPSAPTASPEQKAPVKVEPKNEPEIKESTTKNPPEVPEKVLKEILSMDDVK